MINKTTEALYPTISIVTVVFNGKLYLEKTIKSVLSQSYPYIEYIIIDGCSTDGTKNIIEKYKDKISHSVCERDNGIYDAMNKGLDAVTGDFVWFINAGDELYNKDIVKNIFLDYHDIDVFYGTTQLIYEDGSYASITKVPNNLIWKNFIHGMVVSHQSIIIRRQYVNKYNLDYGIVSDYEWVISALKQCKNIKNTNMIMSKYLLGGFSNQNFFKGWKNRLHISLKHFGVLGLLLNIFYFFKDFIKKILKDKFDYRKGIK